MKKLSLLVLIFFIILSRADHYFCRLNDSFSVHAILGAIPQELEGHLTASDLPWDLIFNQKFRYLKKGHQSFAFVSEDQKYILKCYRFPSHLRRFPWTARFASYHLSNRRKEIKNYNIQKLKNTFHSYELAMQRLKDDCALIAIHLKKTRELHKSVTLIDRLGFEHRADLDSLYFIVQKKAELIFPKLEEWQNEPEKILELRNQLAALIERRCRKNIADTDAMIGKNYGWINGKAINIDVGSFREEECLDVKRTLETTLAPLNAWLTTE